uniref:Uncharacterized protein n=1 Tax=Oryza rufipogon TaxID=4529 RepID=A0A0E0NWU7_ORYRU
MDSDIHFPPTWTDLNVTNWGISIRYLARKKDRYAQHLEFREDIDAYSKKLAAILYNSPSPSNKIRNHAQAVSKEI